MQPSFPAEFLRCPACDGERTLRLEATERNQLEVREGTLRCERCGRSFELHRGVAELLIEPPEHVRKEAAGLERFAEHMRNDSWDRERILQLPDINEGYWYVQTRSFQQLTEIVQLQPGQSVLDVGSNTCWAANRFAQAGLRAIALDISTAELQGLYTADYFLEAGTSYFERVLGTMNDMPIASGSLDYVFCCEVLHHNDLLGLWRTFREAHRVLRPGGKLLVINETLKCLRDPNGVHTGDMDQFEGYEHAHWALQYWLGARLAGFSTELLEPVYKPFFDPVELHVPAGMPHVEALRRIVYYLRHSSRTARRAYLMWLNNIVGGVSFSMIATKGLSI
jgi:SAM-dependent methyltransferase